MICPNAHAVPSGGWFFYEGPHKIVGVGLDDLVKLVWAYRRSNGMDTAHTDTDVCEQICERNPGDCSNGLVFAATPEQQATESTAQWIKGFDGLPALTDSVTSQKRAEDGCVGCPRNQAYGCCANKQPKGTLGSQLESLRQGRDVERYASELFACSAYGWDNRLAVLLDADTIREMALDKQPANLPKRCWVPSTLQ